MLDVVRATIPAGTKLFWSNMREEPLIYVNGRPFVVREIGNPFGNLEYTGTLRCHLSLGDNLQAWHVRTARLTVCWSCQLPSACETQRLQQLTTLSVLPRCTSRSPTCRFHDSNRSCLL